MERDTTTSQESPEQIIQRLAESDNIFAFQETLNTLFYEYFGSDSIEGTFGESRQKMAYHLQVINDTLISAHQYSKKEACHE